MKPLTTKPARSPLKRAYARRLRTQRGATAVEFVLVFPLFFTILYAIITFSLVMVAQQNLTLAAEEGARAALNWQSNTSLQTALDNRAQAACTAAKAMVASLVQTTQCASSSTNCGPGNAMKCVNVALTYDYKTNPLVPTLPLMSYTIPDTLSSSATVQLNPENIQ
ncbi:TadE/TadG family type IV pilus assembly protein [Paraburkholderia sp. IMGN_8]|uniref:TadE/TadG family type IV pilus assembly protein n=1 Tax=Paraburkholderia sp. IMGN_8 TaxID=3136564 RepID=UPI003101B439